MLLVKNSFSVKDIILSYVDSNFRNFYYLQFYLILHSFLATYFKSSSYKYYRTARNDIIRELSQKRLETDLETTEWLNEFLRRFWLIFEPVLSTMVVQKVDAILAASTPAFLDSVRLSTFTLGTKPPRVESVKSYPRVEDDIVVCIRFVIVYGKFGSVGHNT